MSIDRDQLRLDAAQLRADHRNEIEADRAAGHFKTPQPKDTEVGSEHTEPVQGTTSQPSNP